MPQYDCYNFNNDLNNFYQASTPTSQSYYLDSTMDYCIDYIETIDYDDDVFV